MNGRGNGGNTRIQLLVDARKHAPDIIMADRGGCEFPTATMLFEYLPLSSFQPVQQIVKPLLALVDGIHHARKSAVLGEFDERTLCHGQTIPNPQDEASMQSFGLFFHLLAGADYQLGSRGRSRRAQVRHEVNDREVSFMAHRGDDRDLRARHRACEPLMVECSEIFGRAASTSHNDDVHIAGLIEVSNARSDFDSRTFALHLRGVDQNVGSVMSPMKDVQNIAQGSSLGRRHDSNAPRHRRNRFLAGLVKQAFCSELCLELLMNLSILRPPVSHLWARCTPQISEVHLDLRKP